MNNNYKTVFDRLNDLFVNGKTKVDMSRKTGLSINTIKKHFSERNEERFFNSKYFNKYIEYLDADLDYVVFGKPGKGISTGSKEFKEFLIEKINGKLLKLKTSQLYYIMNLIDNEKF